MFSSKSYSNLFYIYFNDLGGDVASGWGQELRLCRAPSHHWVQKGLIQTAVKGNWVKEVKHMVTKGS